MDGNEDVKMEDLGEDLGMEEHQISTREEELDEKY